MKPDKPQGERGALLIRVSDDKQDTQRQRSQLEGYLTKHGLTAGDYYVDEGSSRHRAESRPGFQRLMRDVDAGKWDWLLIDHQDRLGFKHAAEYFAFVNRLIDGGCQLWSVAQGYLSNQDDAAAVVMGSVGGLQSRQEQKDKSWRTVGGHVTAAKRGLYQGGHLPYGCDVGIFGRDGREKWRVVIVGKRQRLKVYSDGSTEEFNGKDNFPGYDPTDEPKVIWSRDEVRLQVVRQLFDWYATEAVNFNQLANRLNRLGIKPYYGERWRSKNIQELLGNPIYAGIRAWGKSSQADFFRYRDGEIREVPWHKNRPVKDGKTYPGYVTADNPSLERLVAEESWTTVQNKLKARQAQPYRPARTSGLWLKEFLICGGCGKPMQGWNPRNQPYMKASFVCGTYNSNGGRNNSAGCRRNGVESELIEALVNDYLEKTHRQIRLTMEGREGGALLDPMLNELGVKGQELAETYSEMLGYVADCFSGDNVKNTQAEIRNQITDGTLKAGKEWTIQDTGDNASRPFMDGTQDALFDPDCSAQRLDLLGAYRVMHDIMTHRLKADLAAKERELEDLFQKFKLLNSPLVLEKASQDMARLEGEIGELKVRLAPLTDRLDEIYGDIDSLGRSVETAKAVLSGDSNRRKAEALKAVISRIVCHFRHTEFRGNRPQSVLERVEIFPVEGMPTTISISHQHDRSGSRDAVTVLHRTVKNLVTGTKRRPDPGAKEAIYKIRASRQTRIEALHQELTKLHAEMITECESILSESQKSLLVQRREAAVRARAAKSATATAPVASKPADKPGN